MVRGDLLREPVEAIVNAANGHLAHGGGVAGIIARAAGPALQAESDRLVAARGPFATGSAVVTGAGGLPFKGVIHAVGPRYGEGDGENKLSRALTASRQEPVRKDGTRFLPGGLESAFSPCRWTSAPGPISGPRAPRRCVMSGYACATNR